MVEITRTAKVGEDGMIHFVVPNVEPGASVQVTVRERKIFSSESDVRAPYRTIGGLEGKIRIADDFDAPVSEMEPYSGTQSFSTPKFIFGRSLPTRDSRKRYGGKLRKCPSSFSALLACGK